MSVERIYFLYKFVLLTLTFRVPFTNSLELSSGDANKVKEVIKKYFPLENNICVFLAESDKEVNLPQLHVPVVVFTQDQLLEDCGRTLTNQDGYVFMTSSNENIWKQIVPLLKCLNRTDSKLKSKYILILDFSRIIRSNIYENYSIYFHNLWNQFGIINIGIFPVQYHSSYQPLIVSYNPFLAPYSSPGSALILSPLTQDVRGVMIDRFRNMYGHRLKTVFYKIPSIFISLEDFSTKQTLGAEPTILLKQFLEESLNASLDLYESPDDLLNSEDDSGSVIVREFSSGRAEYCIILSLLPQGGTWLEHVEVIITGVISDLVVIVPTPKQVESWRLFQYIFQWQVCVGLGVVMVLLSGTALIFVRLHSNTSTSSHNSNRTSEIVSLWRAFLSVPTNRLPSSHSQRLLIALSLLLGLIFLTLCSVQLFALIKSKPRISSIKTLQDLSDSDLPIYSVYQRFSQYLNSFENTTLHRLKDNLRTDKMYENLYYLDPRYLNISDRAMLYTNVLIGLVSSLPHSKAYLHYFEVVKEPIFQTSLVMYLPIGSVYSDHFNNINLKLISGGFYTKWYDANKYELMERYAASSTPRATGVGVGSQRTENDRVPLTYDDLRMAFYILYIGLTAAALCFLFEICTFYNHKLCLVLTYCEVLHAKPKL